MDWNELISNPTLHRVTLVIVELLALWVVVRIISHHGMRSVDDHRTRYRFRKSMTYAGLFFAALILVLNFSEKFEGFGVALGVAGAGIAFALQEVIASVAGWVVISVGRIYSAGDRIEVGGIKGDVIDIGMLRTTLMELGEWVKGDLYTGRIVRVSNSAALKGPVFNYSADFPFLWDEITLPVRYGSDWKHARVMFERVVHDECDTYAHASRAAWEGAVGKYQLEDAKIEPMVTMVANDNWIEFTIRYIVDYRKRRTTKHALFTRLLEEVDASQDRIRLASATFELTNLPRIDVKFRDGTGEITPRFAP